MTSSAILTALAQKFTSLHPDAETRSLDPARTGFESEITLPLSAIREASRALTQDGFFLECLLAADFAEVFELAYVWNRWDAPSRLVIKALASKEPPVEAPSIADLAPAADWYEREIFDFFGLRFAGASNRRLILPDNALIHPLLKSFKGEPDGSDVKQVSDLLDRYHEHYEVVYPRSESEHRDEYTLNLGPQHPSTHGVLRVVTHLKGERILSAEPVLGYVHRNHEKMAEIQEYKAFWPNIGRLDYVGAMSYNFGYAGLIERAMGIEAPPRAQSIRVITTELNRISSHLLWLGTYLLDLGAFTPFFYCFDDRERILDMLEWVTGERLTYDYFRFGGVDRDFPEERLLPAIREFIPHFRGRIKDYRALVGQNVIFRQRTEGVGRLDVETARKFGVTGPSLRASGIAYDIRRSEPYSIYPQLEFSVPTASEGDAYARYRVRMDEMEESLRIVEQLYQKVPAGEYKSAKLPRFVPKGETYFAVETPRGLLGFYLYSDGTLQPYRLKLRTPCFSNLSVFHQMVPGAFLADLVSVLGSLDIVVPDIDR